MGKIPYKKRAGDGNVYFVKPDGEVINTRHKNSCWAEDVIEKYCTGPDYHKLCSIKGCWGCQHMDEKYKKMFPDSAKIDVLMGSKLSEEDKEKLRKYWDARLNKRINVQDYELYTTFVICYLGWDRINLNRQRIDTAMKKPDEKYQEYIDWGYDVYKWNPLVMNENGELHFDPTYHETRKIYGKIRRR